MTADPLGFEDGLNLYAFVHNNPLRFKDPDGQFAFVIPLLFGTFGGGAVIGTQALSFVGYSLVTAAAAWCVHRSLTCADSRLNQVKAEDHEKSKDEQERQREKFKFPENPDDLMPELERDGKGRIRTADNIRIR